MARKNETQIKEDNTPTDLVDVVADAIVQYVKDGNKVALQFDPAMLQAPVPGMSLTKEPGEAEWENPQSYLVLKM